MYEDTNADQAILDRAIEAVEHEARVRLRVESRIIFLNDQGVDDTLQLEPGGKKLAVEIKKWAQQANIGALIHQVQQLPEGGLLVADYINPKMADKPRQQGVQFIDSAGNAFIDQPPVYVYVTGNRQEEQDFKPATDGVNRAFEPKGLMVVYAFLLYPKLVNAPYREIAEKAGVAVGTVGWVLNGLKAAGFIRDAGSKKGRRLTQYRKLLDRWVEVWPEKLKPKQFVGEFVTDNPYWWTNVEITEFDGF